MTNLKRVLEPHITADVLTNIMADYIPHVFDHCEIVARAVDRSHTMCLLPFNRIAFALYNQHLNVVDLKDGQIQSLQGHTYPVSVIHALHGTNRLVSGSFDKTVKIWDMANMTCCRTLQGHDGYVTALCSLCDDSLLVSGSSDNTLKIWDLSKPSGEYRQTMKGHVKRVSSVCALPSGTSVASGSWDGFVKIWDLSTGKCTLSLEDDMGHISTVCAPVDGTSYIVSASHSRQYVKIWDVPSGKCVRTLKCSNDVGSMCLIQSENRIALGNSDGTIDIFDMLSGVLLQKLKGQFHRIHTIMMSDTKMVSCDKYSVRSWS